MKQKQPTIFLANSNQEEEFVGHLRRQKDKGQHYQLGITHKWKQLNQKHCAKFNLDHRK